METHPTGMGTQKRKKTEEMIYIYNVKTALLLVCFCTLLTLPFIGMTDFNTKGEPREALVVMSMLESDNWVFPFSEGGDIAYKPPFFHWCVLMVAKVTGELNEFSSRLPSLLAFLCMLFCIVVRIKDRANGVITALVLFSMFEVHRAAVACRVDMMLAACMTVALCFLYQWTVNGFRHLPYAAIIAMSFAILTKGPVGLVLPCAVGFVFGIFQITRNDRKSRIIRIVRDYFVIAVLSLIIPLAWYYKAYMTVGDMFLNLVIEENFGRFIGRMSYESHSNPFFMPLVFLLAGALPFSLLLLMLLPSVKWKKTDRSELQAWIRRGYERFVSSSTLTQYSILSITIITLFYCIPSSKRSVYLLPVYPFLSYLVALILRRISRKVILCYTGVIATLCCILSLLLLLVHCVPCPESLVQNHGGKDIVMYYQVLHNASMGILGWIVIAVPAVAVISWLYVPAVRRWISDNLHFLAPLWSVLLYLIIDAAVLPAVLNAKSDRWEAQSVERIVPQQQPIYSYCSAPMMRFFAIDFYTEDRVRPFDLSPQEKMIKAQVCRVETVSREGYVLVSDKDVEEFMQLYARDYDFSRVYRSRKKGCDVKSYFGLYKFTRK